MTEGTASLIYSLLSIIRICEHAFMLPTGITITNTILIEQV